MTTIICIVFWLPVIVIKVALILLGIVIVPAGMLINNVPKLYRADANRPQTWWEMVVRNPVNGFKHLIEHPRRYDQAGEVLEATLTDKRFQWRWRRHGLLASIRLLWQYNPRRYGELYVGWKLGSEPPDLDFALSLRPFAETGQ